MASRMPASRYLQVWFARAEQVIGRAGLCGVALMAAAVVVVCLAWNERSHLRSDATELNAATVRAPSSPGSSTSAQPAAEPVPELAALNEVPLLLTQIKQIALNNGLGWTAADYRLIAATDIQPPSLEIRSTFKAPYPKLRKMLSQVLQDVPAATLRELNLGRPSSDIAEVDAKLVIAVLLQEASPAAVPAVQNTSLRTLSRDVP